MTFRVAFWDILNDSLEFNMQGKKIYEHTNGKCHVSYVICFTF